MPNGSIMGGAVKRVEDPRFITGSGRYLSDIEADGSLWLVPVRSDVPHGVLEGVDIEAGKAVAGVVDVFLAEDLELEPMPLGAPKADAAMRRPVIAADRVRFVGEIVAAVVAETQEAAVDAASLVWPDIDPLPVVTDPVAALEPGSELLFPELGTNAVYDRGETDDSVLEDAEVIVDVKVVNQRLAAVPLEPNGALAIPNETGGLDIWTGNQSVAAHRRALETVLGLDAGDIRVLAPDIGGGFGAKISLYPEQALCAAIALKLGRPVRWEETRTENFVAMTHGRAQTSEVRLGAKRDGVITGLSIETTQDAGAYPLFGAYLPELSRRMSVGPYAIPEVEFRWRSAVTNTTSLNAYRGAGRPEATMAIERVMDVLADELDMDPGELRRKNYIQPEAFPHVTAVRERYDTGNYEAALDLALELSQYERLREEQTRRRESGDRWLLGIGISSYVEITAGGGRDDWSSVEVHPDGSATVTSGAVSNGQGHETTFPQIVASLLKIPLERIDFVQGDTEIVPHGGGTMASRSLQIAGSAVFAATESAIHKARSLYAFHNEAALDDVVQFEDGSIGVVGVPSSSMTLAQLAAVAADPSNLSEDMEPGLIGEEKWEQEEATFPFGSHVSVVEVDSETGDVRIRQHIACDDAGLILNRIVVDGQVHGGVAQGIGQALLELFAYQDGSPATANMTSYLIPTAENFPYFVVEHTETPTDQNPLGAKGIGEAGTIGSTPAVVNAVVDALSHLGVTDLEMPLTPFRIWSALQAIDR